MEILAIIVVVVVIAMIVGIMRARELERAKQAYTEALARLTASPSDNHLRIATLEAGRHYADLARKAAGAKGRAMFDEVALNNDLGARVATAPAQPVDRKQCPRCAELVQRKAQICRFCQHDFALSRNVA